MFVVSNVIDRVAALAGPRAQYELFLRRMSRWNKLEIEWYFLDRLVDPNRAAVDVGANRGDYAARLSQLCPKVYAFEPLPWYVNDLRKKLRSNVDVRQLALSNCAGETVIRVAEEDPCLSTIDSNNVMPPSLHVQNIPCQRARLDQVISEPVGFIKIDVEGHELAAVEGALGIIRRDRPVLLIESEKRHNPACPEALFALLRAEGYDVFHVAHGEIVLMAEIPPISQVNNFIFRPKAS